MANVLTALLLVQIVSQTHPQAAGPLMLTSSSITLCKSHDADNVYIPVALKSLPLKCLNSIVPQNRQLPTYA